MKSLFILFLCSFFTTLNAQTRDQWIQFLNESITKVASQMEANPKEKLLSPPEHLASLKAIFSEIQKTGDVELLKLLLQYQVSYQDPENDQIARMLGQIFFDQTNSFQEAYELLNANQRILVFPYLKFGWSIALEGKNTSIPFIAEKQKRFDKIARGLINLRGYTDQ